MTLSIGCHQLSFSPDKIENLNKMLHLVDDSDADLDVFPEYAMGVPESGLSRDYVKRNAEPIDGSFVTKILERTLRKESSVIFTMFLSEGSSVYNAVVLADAGKIKAVYRKIHLFDAFGYKESAMFTSGKELAIVDLKGFTVGLAICFDFRFPELFRQLAYRGVNLFIVPSAWYKGEHKLEQWRILAKARAHENASYLVAVDQAGPFFVGHSIVVSPMAQTVHEAEEGHTTFTVELDRREIEKAKESMSILRLAKPELYRSFDIDRRKQRTRI